MRDEEEVKTGKTGGLAVEDSQQALLQSASLVIFLTPLQVRSLQHSCSLSIYLQPQVDSRD
jgi:hypothetical protein